MLLGQFGGKIDEKNRVGFPNAFRKPLGDSLIVTKGFEGSLIIVSEKDFLTLTEGTHGKPITDKKSREIQRFLLGGASSVVLDSKGRFIIPEYLRKHGKLSNEVVFLGIQRYVELWDKDLWRKHEQELGQKVESIADLLSSDDGK